MTKPTIQAVDQNCPATEAPDQNTPTPEAPVSIEKPKTGSLERFRVKRDPNIAGVETLLTKLPIEKIGDTRDFVRLHPDEEKYWSPPYCFVDVPIIGQKKDHLHLIDEDLAVEHLSSKQIKRFRLAIATKPHDNFFLCFIPAQHLDNAWNEQAIEACQQAKKRWVKVQSRKAEGIDGYKIDFARDEDAFPEPRWPSRSLDDLIEVTFSGRMIADHNHPGLLRLIGAKQSLK